jgi:hypothetical protein
MKKDKLIPGLILVAIGVAFLLNNFGYLHFRWGNIFHLWPIFLVIAGVNLVFANNNSTWATILKFGVAIIGLGLLFFGNFNNRFNYWPGFNYTYNNDNDNDNSNNDMDDNDDNDSSSAKMTGDGVFTEPYRADIKVARLDITGGGTVYTLNDTTNLLFDAKTKDTNNWYDFSHHTDDSVYVVDFHMKNHHGFNFDSDKNSVIFRLNPIPVWDIHVETGATKLDFDLTKFKIRELHLHGGAASFNIKLGQPLAITDVDIETGVSGVDMSIPKNAACSIETDSGLSHNHFDGFNKTSDNNYETPGYTSAKNKMHIHISGGLSDFKVMRY